MRRAAILITLLVGPACRRTHVPPTVRAVPVATDPEAAPDVAPERPRPVPAPVPVAVPVPAPVPAPAPVPVAPQDGGGTVNGDVNGPKAEALNAVVAAAQPALQGCLDGAAMPVGTEIEVRVSYKILPNGRTVNVEASAPGAPREAVDCMRGVADGLRFPPFGGEAVSGSFPYAYRRGR